MWAFLTIAVVGLVLACTGVRSPARMEVSRADERRRDAQVAADAGALREVLNDSLTYRHSDGRVETKEELIESLVSGAVDYRAIDVQEFEVRRCSQDLEDSRSACVRALQTLHVSVAGEEFTVAGCYRARYVPSRRSAQMIDYESAMLTSEGECPLDE